MWSLVGKADWGNQVKKKQTAISEKNYLIK